MSYAKEFKLSQCNSCVLDEDDCSKFKRDTECDVEIELITNLETHLLSKNFTDKLPMRLLIDAYVDLDRSKRVVDKTTTNDLFCFDEEELKRYSFFVALKEKKMEAIEKMLTNYSLTPKAQQDTYFKAKKLKDVDTSKLGKENMTTFFSDQDRERVEEAKRKEELKRQEEEEE